MATKEYLLGNVKGPKGDIGPDGKIAKIKIGKTYTGPAGSNAIVINRGTESDAELEFTIPRGNDGKARPTTILRGQSFRAFLNGNLLGGGR